MTPLLTLHNPSVAKGFYAQGIWKADTFYSLLRQHAAVRPDAFALRDAHARITWGELLARVDAVAEDLRQSGLRPGQRVSVWLANCVDTVIVFLACSRNGYVCNFALHHNYTVGEVCRLLERVQNVALFTKRGHGADGAAIDVMKEARRSGCTRRIYAVEPGRPPALVWEAASDSRELASVEPVLDADKIVCLSFTSGTTGEPKGVMHSENTLLSGGRDIVKDWGHDANTVLLCLSPLSHAIGFVAMAQMIVAGCEMVVNDPPKGAKPLDWIIATGATYVLGVPTHAIDVLADRESRNLPALGSVRTFYMGGAPIPRRVAESMLALGISPLNVYGMTENGAHQYTRPADDLTTVLETVGRTGTAYDIRIFDPENRDRELPLGEVGEIGGRGGMLMLGYFGDQGTTENAFNLDGWFMTGDLGSLDEKGCLRIIGRKKDLVIRGGRNIHPAPIEDLVMRHPSVLKAAGFPIPDDRLGEKLCMAIVLKDGAQSVAGEDILVHLNQMGLSTYDMPEYIVIASVLPLSASGKVLKRELVEWFKSGRIVPTPIRWRN